MPLEQLPEDRSYLVCVLVRRFWFVAYDYVVTFANSRHYLLHGRPHYSFGSVALNRAFRESFTYDKPHSACGITSFQNVYSDALERKKRATVIHVFKI